MPNHIHNELTASKEVLDFLMGSDSDVDFNNIMPMPDILRGRSPHMGVIEAAKVAMGVITVQSTQAPIVDAAGAFGRGDYRAASAVLERSNTIRYMTEGPFPKSYSDKDFADFIDCCKAIKETGHTYWHEWACDNWGTKWNAYRASRVSEEVIKFETAWSAPAMIIMKLSDKFPKAKIMLRWADEDFGCNVGIYHFENTSVAGGPLKNNSREAMNLALDLIYGGIVPDHMKRDDNGMIVYVETD